MQGATLNFHGTDSNGLHDKRGRKRNYLFEIGSCLMVAYTPSDFKLTIFQVHKFSTLISVKILSKTIYRFPQQEYS